MFRDKSHAVPLQVITGDPREVIGLQELSRPLQIRRNIKSKMTSGLCIRIRPKNTGLTVETPERSGNRWRSRSLPRGEVKELGVKKKEPLTLSECSVMRDVSPFSSSRLLFNSGGIYKLLGKNLPSCSKAY